MDIIEADDSFHNNGHGQKVNFALGGDDDIIKVNTEKKENPNPIFTQLNVKLEGIDKFWREQSRWVRFQEDVEDGGERWSKPFVPSLPFEYIRDLSHQIENGHVLFDVKASNFIQVIDKIMDSLMWTVSTENHAGMETQGQYYMDEAQIVQLNKLLRLEVHHHMKLGLIRRISHAKSISRTASNNDESHKNYPMEPTQSDGAEGHSERKKSFFIPEIIYNSSKEDKPQQMQLHNQFTKKVPTNAEACCIMAATVNCVNNLKFILVHLEEPVVLSDFCEIMLGSRYLSIIMGPPHLESRVLGLGKALGIIMSDEIFSSNCASSRDKKSLVKTLEEYTNMLSVLPPSAWDSAIRLEPPKSLNHITNRPQGLRCLSNGSRNSSVSQTNRLIVDSTTAKKADVNFMDNIPNNNNDKKSIDENHIDEPGEEEDDGVTEENSSDTEELEWTGRIFGGLMNDVRRKIPWYISDFTDALNFQTIASIIYIYLATVTKAITFGGFLSDMSGGLQGVLEAFLGHALAGGVFCLFAGQPLTVLGCTGPVLIFEKILIEFCRQYALDYMTTRLWIGLWSCLFCLLIVMSDASVFIKYFTRFTEESFAALIGIIFIIESFKKICVLGSSFKVRTGYDYEILPLANETCTCHPPYSMNEEILVNATKSHPEVIEAIRNQQFSLKGNYTFEIQEIDWNIVTTKQCQILQGSLLGQLCQYVPDIFFFSVILFVGTFSVAFLLKEFRNSPFFPAKIRSIISDYAVIISILIFVAVDIYYDLKTPKLIVPTEFKPTRSDIRHWLIPFTHESMSWWMYIATIFPAFLFTVLIFMDQQITTVIVNRREHKLKKGCGYHLDMLIIGVMVAVSSILGLPWCVAATVLCLGHVHSLRMETDTSAPGERPQFLGIREQRVTGIMVFVLTGISVKLAPILKFIPMPVLYGVLMYMGWASLQNIQFIDRVGLLLMPQKYQPDYDYIRHVPQFKIHLFTTIQIIALAALWLIKSTPASIIFPLMVLALVGFRSLMDFFPRVFSQNDLYWLDNITPYKKKCSKKKFRQNKKKNSVNMITVDKFSRNNNIPENGKKDVDQAHGEETNSLLHERIESI